MALWPICSNIGSRNLAAKVANASLFLLAEAPSNIYDCPVPIFSASLFHETYPHFSLTLCQVSLCVLVNVLHFLLFLHASKHGNERLSNLTPNPLGSCIVNLSIFTLLLMQVFCCSIFVTKFFLLK